MSDLAQLQQEFQHCVLAPRQATAPAWVSAAGRAKPELQLNVYCYAYRARLKEVLVSDFAAVHMAIGDDAFDALAEAYIQTCPSHYYSLRDFGTRLPEFMQHHPDYQALPWLHELAVFEWALCAAFDAADATALTEYMLADISAAQWPTLSFVVHPSVHRLDFQWNIPPMWQVLTAEVPTHIQAHDEEPTHWLIWRDDLITRFRSLEADEAGALDGVLQGSNFTALCSTLSIYHEPDVIPLRAATLLKGWIQQGLLTGTCSEFK